jgi:hypothetical protein
LAGFVLAALLLAGLVLAALLAGLILTLLRVALLMLTVALIVLVVRHLDVLRYSRVGDSFETAAQLSNGSRWRWFLIPAAGFICDALITQEEFSPDLAKARAGVELALDRLV